MLYFDTSFLAPLILAEATSEKIERLMSRLPAGELAVSHWTRVEFSSLLAREVRMGGLAAEAARQADAQFEAMVAESFVVWPPVAADFEMAKQHLARFETGMRAGDALHLAIAANNKAEKVYSLDKGMAKAGKMLGLRMGGGRMKDF